MNATIRRALTGSALAAVMLVPASGAAASPVSQLSGSPAATTLKSDWYETGYRHGFQDGWKDAYRYCSRKHDNRRNMRPDREYERGYADGYSRGFDKAYGRFCHKRKRHDW